MKTTWDYTNTRQYRRRIAEGMPPLIITCAITGDHQKTENPNLPMSGEEQAEAAAAIYAAGAQIVHIHGRQADDPTQGTSDAARYYAINAMMRAKAPQIMIDNTQTATELPGEGDGMLGALYRFRSGPLEARPEVMSLNPGPMTFRGGEKSPSSVVITTFEETEKVANEMRERGIKPQIFIYHPGHFDLLEYLISHDALDKPYFVQLVFGQQSGIATNPENLLFTVKQLLADTLFQTCALGLEAIQVNTLAILLGGHVRTGMEDCLEYQRGELAQGNVQLVERVVRIANELGRPIATSEEARRMLGIGAPTQY